MKTKLSPRQEAAVGFLLTEKTAARAAKKAGISEATLRRWQAKPEFAAAVQAARRRILSSAVSKLQAAADQAADALVGLLRSKSVAVKFKAATAVLDRGA